MHNEYSITLPDPCEYVRALAQAGEMIFSMPVPKLNEFMNGHMVFVKESMYANEQMMMEFDFTQPDIYKKQFKERGMGEE